MSFACPSCQAPLQLTEKHQGQRVRCPQCQEVITVSVPVAPTELDEFLQDEDAGVETSPQRPANRPAKRSQTCPMCGARNAQSNRHCESCGEPLERRSRKGSDDDTGGVWRDGKLLVMRKKAKLPDRCVKTNAPAERWLKRTLYWHHPLVYLTAIAGLLLYVIVALIVRQTAKIQIGLSQAALNRRRLAILLGWILALGAFVLFCFGFTLLDRQTEHLAVLAIFGGLFGGLVVVAVSNHIASCIRPAKITDEYVWLKGVHPDYLAELPEWDLDE